MNRIISFPHLGNYYIAFEYFLSNATKCKVIVPPDTTKKTIELGAKYSPDFVCVPFKYNLGNYIEALEKGANVLIQGGGGCRYGYFGELEEKILRDLGYDFEFYNMIDSFKNNCIFKNICLYFKYKRKFKNISINKETNHFKVAILGELYSLIDANTSYNTERKLIKMGIEVYRDTDLTYLLITKRFKLHKMIKSGKKYIRYHLGADASGSVVKSYCYAMNGFDGILHLKSFGCTPEISAMNILFCE